MVPSASSDRGENGGRGRMHSKVEQQYRRNDRALVSDDRRLQASTSGCCGASVSSVARLWVLGYQLPSRLFAIRDA